MGDTTCYSIDPKLDAILTRKKKIFTAEEKKIITMCKKSGISIPEELDEANDHISLQSFIEKVQQKEDKNFCIGLTGEDYVYWDTIEKDMKKLSLNFPAIVIKLLVVHDQGYVEDCDLYYFKNGKMQKAEREPFDESKLA